MTIKSVSSIEEIYEVSRKLEEHNKKKTATKPLEQQVEDLIEAHNTLAEAQNKLTQNFYEFAKATLQSFKEISEENEPQKTE